MMAAQQCHNIENYWSADQQFFPAKEFEITSRHLYNALKNRKIVQYTATIAQLLRSEVILAKINVCE